MSLWSRFRNYEKLNTLEDEINDLTEALKEVPALKAALEEANSDVEALIAVGLGHEALIKQLTDQLESVKAERIQVTETMRVSMTGVTVSIAPVSDPVEEPHVSMEQLSKTLAGDYVYVQ